MARLLIVVFDRTSKIPVVFPPEMVRFDWPKPLIVTLPVASLIVMGEVNNIVPFWRLGKNVIVSSPGLVAAKAIASRNDPAPEFAVLDTSNLLDIPL